FTSCNSNNVIVCLETIKSLQKKFFNQIQIIPYFGINSTNVKEILETRKVSRIHGSESKKNIRYKDYFDVPVSALEMKVTQAD
ncbi:copper homeostasis protein CutC, partial [Francisella tularensis subsp. holarctica]|nr:copper homeostasis protein CutC [Francisella tularensis subsp. holarctica]